MTSEDLELALGDARRKTNLSDFGPEDFREPLAVYLRLMRASRMTREGREAQRQLIQRCLVNRLRFADDLSRHPEIRDEDVSDPIVVLGFPRSGTTVLQRMISADPAMQSLRFWRTLNPAPFPGESIGQPVGRVAAAEAVENAIRTYNPALFAAHPTIANDAEEDWFLHHLAFQHVGNVFAGLVAPEYLAYLRSLPRLPTYRYVADLLRYLQWQDGGKRGRRWVLKSPVHIGCLDELLSVHPRATLIYPRRDFRTVMASFCHALESSLGSSMEIGPAEIGSIALDFWQVEMLGFHRTRRRLGSHLNLVEVEYRDLLADPIHHIGQFYRRAGTELTAEGAAAIRAWIADNPADKHGKNVYTLERYGLSPEQVDAAFGEHEQTLFV
ncbi:MAG: hypothetical protein JWQ90_2574 [Hydrocarboniphaga sp.]|uniref:sulfotransferase family protein n=1 Tax=Hydrocarboniphaga sp. TaxID=2033016 RepID=UPI0026144CBD|nr:sulfotransferase [Hydrocarboniphaga sp.]MDB5970124.1 hypothetical protein [Hydrocarboniphaga sp.]